MIDFRIEYLPAINYALINNKIAVCQSAEIRNTSTDTLHNLVVECTGEFFITTLSTTIGALRAYDSMRLDKVDILPNPQMVGSLTEKLVTTFTIKVYQDIFTEGEPKSEIFSKEYNVDIMPFDQWLGTSILPQCLASYVMPNHPAISNIVVKAAKLLKDITGTSAFTEYQSGNPNEVLKQVAAVYGALHNENIVYRGVPASYEEIGQRITLPDQVLAQKLGNCVELTLLYASVLENIGINSCIILQRGHAYLGVWLVDDCCPYSVCDDYSYIEKK
ncbi:MAG: transglutaminase domain-containing protein, partial [Bacteroidales bacterium]|nr:transglutaminase domain-containing protein [Candidatus Sodaliphilus fimicaballi]